VRSFTIITVPSNELIGRIHDRMPAIMTRNGYDRWLGTEPDPHDPLVAQLARASHSTTSLAFRSGGNTG
jgi:putative SOS response-associated peptidase YedK